MDSVGQQRMAKLHGGRRDKLEISPNLWAGVGLVRGGAGTALVGDPPTVAARIKEYQSLGIDTFIMSGYPHLEEAYRFAELVFPHLTLSARQRCAAACQHRPLRRDHRQRISSPPQAGTRNHESDRSPSARPQHRLPKADALVAWILPLTILIGWQARLRAGLIPARVLPAPSDVALAGWKLAADRRAAAEHLGQLLARASPASPSAVPSASPLGLANGLSKRSANV